jgi:hypothetical protein
MHLHPNIPQTSDFANRKQERGAQKMYTFSYYFHHYWLSGTLIVGAIAAAWLVYRNRNKIFMRGSGRK